MINSFWYNNQISTNHFNANPFIISATKIIGKKNIENHLKSDFWYFSMIFTLAHQNSQIHQQRNEFLHRNVNVRWKIFSICYRSPASIASSMLTKKRNWNNAMLHNSSLWFNWLLPHLHMNNRAPHEVYPIYHQLCMYLHLTRKKWIFSVNRLHEDNSMKLWFQVPESIQRLFFYTIHWCQWIWVVCDDVLIVDQFFHYPYTKHEPFSTFYYLLLNCMVEDNKSM